VPNRRGVLSLRQAFLKATGGKPTILPRLLALGDIEGEEMNLSLLPGAGDIETTLPPAISTMERELLLARLVERSGHGLGFGDLTAAQATGLAKDLAHLLDQVHTEDIGFDGLDGLVDEKFAYHWQQTTTFLKIITENWPIILADLGKLDPAKRRAESLRQTADQWQQSSPNHPIIIAGSTGSLPQTANLMRVVCRLDKGLVVLPGLDPNLSEDAWEAIDPTHPQFTMKGSLDTMGVSRHEVDEWPLNIAFQDKYTTKKERITALTRALWPAQEIGKWRDANKLDPHKVFNNFSVIPCPGAREEAGVVALMMREALERDGETVALITPDRSLARRVRAELDRWGITVDDSAGTPLAETPIGSYLCLISEVVEENLSPIPLLALLKHPFTTMGKLRKDHLASVRSLEKKALRGPRPAPGFKGLRDILEMKIEKREKENKPTEVYTQLLVFLDQLEGELSPLLDLFKQERLPLTDILTQHINVAQTLATTDQQSGERVLWAGDAGNAAAQFIYDLSEAALGWNNFSPMEYPALFKQMMVGLVVRQTHSTHPRAFIWGTVEARMQQADTVILGGLNEEVWPPKIADDPWMSRPMRKDFGLPAPEVRVGLSAHDFLQSTGADRVFVTRAEKLDSAETVPSRWLMRLEALLATPLPSLNTKWLGYYHELDKPEAITPCSPPRPTPPVVARPTSMYVTDIGTWMQDPYAIYAKKILGLRPLDDLDQQPDPRLKGSIIHDALDGFSKRIAKDYNNKLPPNALDILIDEGKHSFGVELNRPLVWAFWWPQFQRSAKAFILNEQTREGVFERTASEITGSIKLENTASPFTLSAKADRIDTQLSDNSLQIIDYKTGDPPSVDRIKAGYAPQMPLEGVIARNGGFKLGTTVVSSIAFWKIGGSTNPVDQKNPLEKQDINDVMDRAEAGLRTMILEFSKSETPYLSNPRPAYTGYGDYDHLARVKEWQNQEGGND
jgi:ATP-dependent helicase/nuclease subunit B